MRQKSTVLLFRVFLIVLAVMCGGCGQNTQQQVMIQVNTESFEQTTEQGSISEKIETESMPETDETTEEAESTETENDTELIEAEGTTETMETETAATNIETESTEEIVESECVDEVTEEVEETEIVETASEQEMAEQESSQEIVEPVKSRFELISEEIGLHVDRIELDLPDVQNSYELLFINDMHVLKLDESVVAESVDEIRVRQDVMFRTRTGMASAEAWPKLSSVLDDFSADGIILGGDMMDFVSPTNVQILSEGLSQITTPYIYLRADHDLGIWHSGGAISMEDSIALHTSVSSYQDMFIMEYPEFYVLGWNNSTSQLTNDGLDAALRIWNSGKPIILATHVPINSIVDNSLAEAAANVDSENRKKLWGDECLYRPDDTTSAFLGMIYDTNSPVKAVLSGHLHFRHVVQLTEQTVEYVFAPAFEGNVAKIVIK
ncbi:MAG: metallophosphoesterase [Lachnospiraceae bacterium]|nr:metallophosphoesterase [Lachnospiraceae bacterium]